MTIQLQVIAHSIRRWPNDEGLVYAEVRNPTEDLTLGGGRSVWPMSGGDAE